MLDIRRIASEDTYQIRQKVLRPTQSLEDCMYANDNHPDSFHLGAFKHDNLISVASFYQEEHPTLDGGLQYRLRGMATLAEFRNLKAGSSLLMEAELIILVIIVKEAASATALKLFGGGNRIEISNNW